jgi:hypothetical protein
MVAMSARVQKPLEYKNQKRSRVIQEAAFDAKKYQALSSVRLAAFLYSVVGSGVRGGPFETLFPGVNAEAVDAGWRLAPPLNARLTLISQLAADARKYEALEEPRLAALFFGLLANEFQMARVEAPVAFEDDIEAGIEFAATLRRGDMGAL